MNKIICKKILYTMSSIIVIMLFMSCIHPTFDLDEEYTMGLIQHSYKQLININTLDVHPPTYYLILKLILNTFTFWTKSVFIKVIFARLISLSMFVIMFITLCNIVKDTGIHIYYSLQIVFYLSIPIISLYSTYIRMYDLYSALIILEFYNLLKFDDYGNNHYLILATIFTILASYVDYFSAVCGGLFLLIFLIVNIKKRCKHKSIYICISGILQFLACIPLIFLMIRQSKLRSKYVPLNTPHYISRVSIINSFTQTGYLRSIFASMCAFVMLCPLIYFLFYLDNKKFNNELIIVLSNYILTLIFSSVIYLKIPVFAPKFLYPQFTIYSFFIISIFIMILHQNINNTLIQVGFKYCITIFMALLLLISSVNVLKSNLCKYDMPSIDFISKINSYRLSRNKNIYMSKYRIPVNEDKYSKPLYVTQLCIYLKPYHKNVILNKYSESELSSKLVNGNSQLFKAEFNNLYLSKK